jgi:SulP family sulfate permease
VGTAALLLMLPLAATSFNRAIKAGRSTLAALHRAAFYAVALLALLHFFWMRSGQERLCRGGRSTRRAAGVLLGWRAATVICTGLLFGLLGLLRLGSLVRFVPQPVLAGFMNGVAVLIILSQLPPLLGIAPGAWAREGWRVLGNAHVGTVVVGLCTAAAVLAIQRRSPRAPAALLAMLGGLLAGEAVRRWWPAVHLPSLGTLLPILPAPDALAPLWTDAAALLSRHGRDLAVTALLLALIGGLESVLSMAAIDQLTNGRTDPDRELLALAVANLTSGALGGMPLVYLRLRAITTLNSGGRSPRAVGVASVAMALAAVFALPVIERVPAAVLAGIVLTLGLALVDRWTRQLVDQWRAGEATADLRFSLLIVAVVCGVTLVWGFVAGVGAGTLLAMVVFIRTLNHSLLRNRFTAAEIPSRRVYPASLEALLRPLRAQAEVIELEGALFFGNADRLATEADRVRPDLAYLIVDFRRVTTIDASGAVGLAQLKERLGRRGVALLLAGVTRDNRHGLALQAHGVFRTAPHGTASPTPTTRSKLPRCACCSAPATPSRACRWSCRNARCSRPCCRASATGCRA